MNKTLKTLVVTAAVSLLAAFNAQAVVPVNINATNGWTGWTGAHSTTNISEAGNFIGTASGTGQLGSQIHTSGVSWGLYANSGQTAAMIYNFSGGPLVAGDSVSIDFDNGWIQNGGVVGFGLQNSSGVNRFEFYFVGGQSGYTLNDGNGPSLVNPAGMATTLPYTNNGVGTITFIQGASNTYQLLINGSAVDNTGLSLTASDITRIRIFNFNAGNTPNHDAYFNSLVVVPEPSTYALIIGGLALLVFIARRRAALNS